jgi:hypothetical protein
LFEEDVIKKFLKSKVESIESFHAVHQLISFNPNTSGTVLFHNHSTGNANTNDTRNKTQTAVMKPTIAEISELSSINYQLLPYFDLREYAPLPLR